MYKIGLDLYSQFGVEKDAPQHYQLLRQGVPFLSVTKTGLFQKQIYLIVKIILHFIPNVKLQKHVSNKTKNHIINENRKLTIH